MPRRHARGFWGHGLPNRPKDHITYQNPTAAVSDVWNQDHYQGMSVNDFNAAITKAVFQPKHGLTVSGFPPKALEQLKAVSDALAVLRFPVAKLNRVLKTIEWRVKDTLKGATARYDPVAETIRFTSVSQFPYKNKVFDPRAFDTAFSDAVIFEVARAVEEFLRTTGRVTEADLDAFARLCGWSTYEDRSRGKGLMTNLAGTSPRAAFAEYLAAYLSHQEVVHDMLRAMKAGARMSSAPSVFIDRTVRDLSTERARFTWIVMVPYARILE